MRSGQDIQIIKENTDGFDYVIGDVHGNVSVLQSVIKKLNKNDRLFIVGDLVDRGEDSPGVIELIENTNKENPGQIIVNRGNHETLCLKSIKGLEELAMNPLSQDDFWTVLDEIMRTNYQNLNESYKERDGVSDIALHVRNGGEWLLKVFEEEIQNEQIKVSTEEIIYDESYQDDKYQGSRIKLIEKFMTNLPYIVITEGERSFSTVHADAPADPDILLKLAKNGNFNLTEIQKKYATWAREKAEEKLKIKANGRTEDSMLVYVGHTIIDSGEPAVRFSTNTVNLDVAAYTNDIILLVNHTKGTSEFVAADENVNINDVLLKKPQLKWAKKTIDTHLKSKDFMLKVENFFEKNKNLNYDAIKDNYVNLKSDAMLIASDMEQLNMPGFKKFEDKFEAEYKHIESLFNKISKTTEDKAATSALFASAITESKQRNKSKTNEIPVKNVNSPYPKSSPGSYRAYNPPLNTSRGIQAQKPVYSQTPRDRAIANKQYPYRTTQQNVKSDKIDSTPGITTSTQMKKTKT